MAIMSPEVQKAVAEIKPSLVATAGKGGRPNVSPKGSLRVLDDEHLVFVDVRSPNTVANLRENPQVAVLCLDTPTRSGCRVVGRAEIIDAGPLFDKFTQEYTARGMTVKHVVKVAVDEAYTFKV